MSTSRDDGLNNNNDHDGAVVSEVASVAESTAMTMREEEVGEVNMKGRDERDRERWTKLKRLKQAFHVKRRVKGKGKGGDE